jgi:hypothetical protein
MSVTPMESFMPFWQLRVWQRRQANFWRGRETAFILVLWKHSFQFNNGGFHKALCGGLVQLYKGKRC